MSAIPQRVTLQWFHDQRQKMGGLIPEEVLVMSNWLALHESEYDSFAYNVLVGQGVDPGPGYPDSMRALGVRLSQYRIDAIATQGLQATIIEVKRRASLGSIGQLVSYMHLWTAQNPQRRAPILRLVASSVTPDVALAAIKQGVIVDLTPTDFSSLSILSPKSRK